MSSVPATAPASGASLDQTAAIREKLTGGEASALDAVRAFGVVVGPSILLDAAAGVAVAGTVRAVVRRRRASRFAQFGTAALFAYLTRVRPWMLTWGATAPEQRMRLPGDAEVPDAALQITRAVTVDAPVEAVWPWLAQIGQDRGGFYSYEWLENLAGCRMRNAEHVHAEWQERQVGETVHLHHAYGLPVSRFEPGRVVALKGWGAFILERLPDERTRLIARGRTARGMGAIFSALLIEIPHFVMERRMLLGIKARAESAFKADRPVGAAQEE